MSGKRCTRKGSEPASKPTREDHNYSQGKLLSSTPISRDPHNDEFELNPYECKDCKKVIHSRDSPAECDFCENCYCFKCSKVESKEAYKHLWPDKDEDHVVLLSMPDKFLWS